ncbi:MAG: hypothetical protein M5U26_28155 [Planctomycetota bacterium]|nr:hypothetical protein [Planctomycetota bacterium]
MGIFDFLFKKKPVIRLEDPVFGALEYDSYIWCTVIKPDNEKYEPFVTIDAGEEGPSDRQRQLYMEIQERLPEYLERGRAHTKAHAYMPVEASELNVYSFAIGDSEETARQEFVLELTDEDAAFIHRVTFRGTEPVDYGCDD